jgi:uncharacterized FlaG/YvyC family protein
MGTSAINNLGPPVSAPTETTKAPDDEASRRALIQAVRAINATELLGQEAELTFVIDRTSGRAVARIVNRSTRELIKEIPPESVFKLAEEIKGT